MRRLNFVVTAVAVLFAFSQSPAAAQATRTWVSGVGDDANPCSRTAPCKTFAGAISKTAAAGEISVLDPGGFGAVTITKSISITQDSSGEGGILAALTTGIIVNAGPNDFVNLRGLIIEGAGNGINGIRFIAGGSLNIQDCVIRGFRAAGATSGFGIAFFPSGASKLNVSNTLISDNGNVAGSTGGGIQIKPSGTGSAKVMLDRVGMHNNIFGFQANGTVGTGAAGIRASIKDSTASANLFAGIAAVGGTQSVEVFVDHTSSVSNGTTGVAVSGSGGIIYIGNTSVFGNATGLQFTAPGQIISFGNNNVDGNTIDGAPSSTPGQI